MAQTYPILDEEQGHIRLWRRTWAADHRGGAGANVTPEWDGGDKLHRGSEVGVCESGAGEKRDGRGLTPPS